MNFNDLKLTAVNWEHGMLLTPDHFLRQERYFDASLLWTIRYLTSASGLVGGGPRLAEIERGAAKYDPIVTMREDEESLTVTVSQCRGITAGGAIIEITPETPVERTFAKSELETVQETAVYVVCEPGEKDPADGVRDEFNPQMQTERRPRYRLALLASPDQTPYALAAGQVRRQRYGTGFEKNPAYIPACTSMTAHSELAAGYRKIVEQVTYLAERYAELHRAMREYLILFTERGIETEVDAQTVQFVDRVVASLQNCVYELLDSAQPPERFFAQLRRFFHSAAVYFDLTPGMQTYYNTLKEAGETSFIQLIEQQKQILKTTRSVAVAEDLGIEVRAALSQLSALLRLEQALEGKYLDFHVSDTLEAMNFIFDRGGNVLYKLAAKPSRVQGMGTEMITFFSQLRLEGRDRYRLVLVGESGTVFEKGTRIPAEIRINEGSGFQRAPMNLSSDSRIPGQVNFEFDFEAPDVPTITDIKVAVPSHFPIRTALLFSRHRFYAGDRMQPAQGRVEPMQRPPQEPQRPPQQPPQQPPPQYQQPQQYPPQQPPYPPQQPPYPPQQPPQQGPPRYAGPPQAPPQPPQQPPQPPPEPEPRRAPWDIFKRNPEPPQQPPRPRFDQGGGDENPPPPPRRRRLE